MNKVILSAFQSKMEKKEKLLEEKIGALSLLLGINECNIKKRIHALKKQEATLNTLKKFRIKSKVQTYDLRDCEEYQGVLELEKLLQESRKDNVKALNDNIRKSYNKFMTQKSQMALKRALDEDGVRESELNADLEDHFGGIQLNTVQPHAGSEDSDTSHRFSGDESDPCIQSEMDERDHGRPLETQLVKAENHIESGDRLSINKGSE